MGTLALATSVGNFSKCVTVVELAFQVVTLGLNLLDLAMEAKRSAGEVPRIRKKFAELLYTFVEILIYVLLAEGRAYVESINFTLKGLNNVSTIVYYSNLKCAWCVDGEGDC